LKRKILNHGYVRLSIKPPSELLSHTNNKFRFLFCSITGLDFLDDTGADYDNALLSTGFGKFHFLLLTVCGLIYLNTAVGVTILSFVLPSATCDFELTSQKKGWLTAAPMLGTVITFKL
jgi:hypothetical protein